MARRIGRSGRGRRCYLFAPKVPYSFAEPEPPLSALVRPLNQPAAPVGAAPDGPKNRPPHLAAVKLPPEILAADVVTLLKLNDGLRAVKIEKPDNVAVTFPVPKFAFSEMADLKYPQVPGVPDFSYMPAAPPV